MNRIIIIGYILPENINIQNQKVKILSGLKCGDIIADAETGKIYSEKVLKKQWKSLSAIYPWLESLTPVLERDWVNISKPIDMNYPCVE